MGKWDYTPEQDPGYLPDDADLTPFGQAFGRAANPWRFLNEAVGPVAKQMVNPQPDSPYQQAIDAAMLVAPVRTTFSPFKGRTLANIEYYPKSDPGKTMAYIQYSPAEGGLPPTFWSTLSHSVRGTGETLKELLRQLGPRLDDLELGTPISKGASPFWSGLAESKYLSEAPNLVNRIQRGVKSANDPVSNTLQYNRATGLRGTPIEELW